MVLGVRCSLDGCDGVVPGLHNIQNLLVLSGVNEGWFGVIMRVWETGA